jgi:hypothetical protein
MASNLRTHFIGFYEVKNGISSGRSGLNNAGSQKRP